MIKPLSTFIFVVIMLFSCYTVAQKSEPDIYLEQTFKKLEAFAQLKQKDSIKAYAPKFLTVAEQFSSSKFTPWAFYYYAISNYIIEQELCLDMALKAHADFLEQRNFSGIIRTASLIGNIYANALNDIDNSNKYYQLGLVYATQKDKYSVDDSTRYHYQVAFLNNITLNEITLGNLKKSTVLIEQALDLGKLYSNYSDKISTLMNLSNLNYKLRHNDKSTAINYEILALAEKENDIPFISMALNNLAANFGIQDKLDSTLIFLKKGYQLSKEIEDWGSVTLKAINLGHLHTKLKKFEIAGIYYNEALNLTETYHLDSKKAKLYNFIANNYLAQEQYQKALDVLLPNIDRLKEAKNYVLLIYAYQLLEATYEASGNYKSTLHYLKERMAIQDSISNTKIKQEVNKVQTKYETEKKEKQIVQLEQEKLTQKVSFQKQLISAGGTIFLLLTTGLFFFFKNRTQNLKDIQKTTELEQRLLRSQMNPHFTFNALSSIQSYLLKSGQAQKGAYFLAKFAKLMRQILSQSRTSFISIDEEIETLENYLSLQKLRYEETFSYQFNIDKTIDTSAIQIPPMLIQPILENAIEHGKIYTLENGRIAIDITQSNDFLTVKIKDNGIGRQSTSSINAKAYESIALNITKDRIDILQKKYNKKVNFEINDPKDGGTEVLFTLPLLNQYD